MSIELAMQIFSEQGFRVPSNPDNSRHLIETFTGMRDSLKLHTVWTLTPRNSLTVVHAIIAGRRTPESQRAAHLDRMIGIRHEGSRLAQLIGSLIRFRLSKYIVNFYREHNKDAVDPFQLSAIRMYDILVGIPYQGGNPVYWGGDIELPGEFDSGLTAVIFRNLRDTLWKANHGFLPIGVCRDEESNLYEVREPLGEGRRSRKNILHNAVSAVVLFRRFQLNATLSMEHSGSDLMYGTFRGVDFAQISGLSSTGNQVEEVTADDNLDHAVMLNFYPIFYDLSSQLIDRQLKQLQ